MSVVIPSLRAAIAVPPWVKNELWRRARAVPSLDQRFAESKSLVDAVSGQQLITYTLASNGTFTDSAGVIQTAAADVPRFDHDPITGESLGLLVEEQRTNSIRNNTMVGAVAGTPGTLPTNWVITNTAGLTTNVVSVSTENGINYIDLQITGSPIDLTYILLFEGTTQVTAANGQSWSSRFYAKLAGGNTNNIASYASRLRMGTGAGSLTQIFDTLVQPAGASANLATSRIGGANTVTNASTERVTSGLVVNFTATGVATNITLRIGMPQLEQGALAASVIPTATAAVTRSASLADLISGAIANNIRSFYVEFSSPAVGTRGVVSLNDNTANERASVLTSGTDPRLVVQDGGVEQANINGGTVAANVRTRVAVRINADDFAISINGGAVATDTSGTLPTVDRLMFGRTQAGEYLNGRIARFTGWSQLLPNATLQTLAQ